VAGAEVRLDDGGDGQRVKSTDADGRVQFTKFKVSNDKPLPIEVSYALNAGKHWRSCGSGQGAPR
jgi:hypothetical protein